MNVEQLEITYREDTGDKVAAKYLCSSEVFLLRLNEAQSEAARRSHMLVDSRSPLVELSAEAGCPIVQLDPRIIKVRRLTRDARRYPLRPISARDLDAQVPGWESAAPGALSHFVPDWDSQALRLYPAPARQTDLWATVVREPLRPFEKSTDVPEFAPRHHLALLEWVKYRTYSTQDPELFGPQIAANALAAFTLEFGPAIGAINEHWSAEQEYDAGEF